MTGSAGHVRKSARRTRSGFAELDLQRCQHQPLNSSERHRLTADAVASRDSRQAPAGGRPAAKKSSGYLPEDLQPLASAALSRLVDAALPDADRGAHLRVFGRGQCHPVVLPVYRAAADRGASRLPLRRRCTTWCWNCCATTCPATKISSSAICSFWPACADAARSFRSSCC